jgi:hypothetical protein
VTPILFAEEHFILVGRVQPPMSAADWEPARWFWPTMAGGAGIEKLAALWLWADAVDLGLPPQLLGDKHSNAWAAAAVNADQAGDIMFPLEIREAAGPLIEFLNARLPEPRNNSR